MKVLIIGGNGFIGTHLVDTFLQHGHKVRVFDYSLDKFRDKIKDVDYRIFNFDNIAELTESLTDIDIVYHLAGSSVPSTSNLDPTMEIQKNLLPTIRLLEIMVKLKRKKIIFFSSGGTVYGNPVSSPTDENQYLAPISSYGIIKVTIEYYLKLYERLYGIKALIIRPSNPYGPRQGHQFTQGIISTFLRELQLDEELTVFGDGKSTKDYIYISDLVDACYKLSLSYDSGEYNIGSGVGVSINEIIKVISDVTNKHPKIKYTESKKYDVRNFVLDTSKLKKAIKWLPAISLRDGIQKHWDWIIENFKEKIFT